MSLEKLEKAKRKLAMWEEAEDTIAIGGQSYETQGGPIYIHLCLRQKELK